MSGLVRGRAAIHGIYRYWYTAFPDFLLSWNSAIIDPPRAGMHEDVVRRVLELAPPRIVYVSCNPATQARDIALLSPSYTAGEVQPVDMFPHTFHIENVVALSR